MAVPTRRWILVLGLSSSIALAVGIPVTALTIHRSTEVVTGRVVAVERVDRVIIVLRETALPTTSPGRQIAIHLNPGQRIRLAHGSESLEAVTDRQSIRARVGTGAEHRARWVLVVGPAPG
jgi:hypothetical protein